ncbi:MAG: hypothetical protein LUG99_09230 [Lachnospiraceae bacterium]|nr:hypothetical protein [Lachnospiraceae bacterium]
MNEKNQNQPISVTFHIESVSIQFGDCSSTTHYSPEPEGTGAQKAGCCGCCSKEPERSPLDRLLEDVITALGE